MPSAKSPRAYDMSLSDHGFEASERKGLIYPLGDHAPDYGTLYPLAPDLGWTRLPVPGALDHINIWLLDDSHDGEQGVAIADTGLYLPASTDHWKTLFSGPLKGRDVTRIFVTHYHPDHVGCAGWLAREHDAPVWMNRTEWLMARMLVADIRKEVPEEAIERRRFAGWSEDRLERYRALGWGNFAKAVSPLPLGHVRLDEGDAVEIGHRTWRVLTGGGHTPEHVCLIDEHNGAVIAGDQILPRITSNISILDSEPEGDPLGEWLASIAKFREALDKDVLVLPAHGFPFTGAHERLDALAEGHHDRLDALHAAIREKPLRAVDTFGLLFDREIDDSNYALASGEAMAHLRHLERTGRASVELRDGVGWFRAE